MTLIRYEFVIAEKFHNEISFIAVREKYIAKPGIYFFMPRSNNVVDVYRVTTKLPYISDHNAVAINP